MKKITFIIATLFLTMSSICSQGIPERSLYRKELPKEILKAITESPVKAPKHLKNDLKSTTLLLDSITYYSVEDNSRTGYNAYTYDKKGNMKSQKYFLWTNNEWVNYIHAIYDYDENNNQILEEWYGLDDEYLQKYVYAYDKNDNRTLREEYKGKTKNNEWKKISKEVTEYNDKNLTLSYETYSVSLSNVWLLKEKYLYKYDEEYKLIVDESYTYQNNNIQKGNQKLLYWENGLKTEIINLYYQNNQWIINYKDVYTYDDNNNMIGLDYYYYIGNNKWSLQQKIEYSYNDNNLMLQESQYWSNNKWTRHFKIIFEYDKNSNNTFAEYYEGENYQWVAKSKFIMEYNENNRRTLLEYYLAGRDNDWLKSEKEVSKYDNWNNRILYEEYKDGPDNTWGKVYKEVLEFNDDYNLTFRENYLVSNNEWIPDYKVIFEYDKDIRVSQKNYINKDNKFVQIDYAIYHYSTSTGLENITNLTNNPNVYIQDGTLHIDTTNPGEIITIYSSTGTIIYSGLTKSIPVSGLPKGLVIIQGRSGWVKKLITNT